MRATRTTLGNVGGLNRPPDVTPLSPGQPWIGVAATGGPGLAEAYLSNEVVTQRALSARGPPTPLHIGHRTQRLSSNGD
jgi:hypothetical protein